MTRSSDLTSINCTACGAGLDVLGGGRVSVHVCPYCGTELDAQDSYKALRQFSDLKRPDSPFALGMSGRIFDVDYTVIGTLEHKETYGGQVWTWIDHQLFSPTHGYAFLTLEDGHVIFTRRYRKKGWMTEAQVERSENPPTVYSNGERFKYYDTTTSMITFAEGEFTWRAEIGQKATAINAMSERSMLSFSQSGTERETYRSVYLPRSEVEHSFGLSLPPVRRRVHPLMPYKGGPNSAFLRKWAAIFAGICLLLFLTFTFDSGSEVVSKRDLQLDPLPITLPFDVRKPEQLVEIRLRAEVDNSWASMWLEVEDPEGDPLFEAGRTIEYYSGRDSEGSWTEGSKNERLRFVPAQSGTHVLTIGEAETGIWTGVGANPPRETRTVDIYIREGQPSGIMMFWLAVLFGIVAVVPLVRKLLHDGRRWAGSDWDDE